MINELPAIKTLDPAELLKSNFIAADVFNRRTGRPATMTFRLLADVDIADVHSLHSAALQGVADPVMLRPDSRQFFHDHIARKGVTIGAFANDRLIAYGILALPRPDDANFGQDVGLPRHELAAVSHIDGITVDPAWRGNGLQRSFVRMRLGLATAFGRDHALATISPRNYYSWRNLTAVGFRIKGMKVKYNLGWRFILHRRLDGTRDDGPPSVRFHYLDIDDSGGQNDLLRRGFWGYECLETEGGALVAFGRAAAERRGAA